MNVESDVIGAKEAFGKAADMGHPKGALNLAVLHERVLSDAGQVERLRASALESARQHRALMESIDGPEYLEKLEREVHAGGATGATAASGSSCALLAVATLGFVLGVAALR